MGALSYDKIVSVCNEYVAGAELISSDILIGTKTLAVAFTLGFWVYRYSLSFKNIQLSGSGGTESEGLKLWDIVKGCLYIFCIVNFAKLSNFLDEFLSSYESSLGFIEQSYIYDIMDTEWLAGDEEQILEDHSDMKAMSLLMLKITSLADPWWWIMAIIKPVIWFVNGFAFPSFYIERCGLLMIMKVCAPLVLALGAIEAYRPMVKKWVLLYCAIFLTGPLFLFVNIFCDNMYRGLLSVNNAAVSIMPEYDGSVKVLIFMVIIGAKLKLYKGAIDLAYKIFNC